MMYLCPPAHMGKPPGLHEHVSKARRVGEPPNNTEMRGGKGASDCQPCMKKTQFAVA